MTANTQFSVRRLLALAYARVNEWNLAHKRDKSCTRISCANEPCLAQCNNDWYPYDGLTRKIYALVCVTYRVLTWGSLISKQVMYWNFMRYEPCPAWYNNDMNRYEGRNGRRASCSTWGLRRLLLLRSCRWGNSQHVMGQWVQLLVSYYPIMRN